MIILHFSVGWRFTWTKLGIWIGNCPSCNLALSNILEHFLVLFHVSAEQCVGYKNAEMRESCNERHAPLHISASSSCPLPPTHPSSHAHIMRHHGMTVSETHRVLAPNTNAMAAALQSNSPSKLCIRLGKLAALLDADHATRDRERLNFWAASEIVALSHAYPYRALR